MYKLNISRFKSFKMSQKKNSVKIFVKKLKINIKDSSAMLEWLSESSAKCFGDKKTG
jgi:hypothetical protein